MPVIHLFAGILLAGLLQSAPAPSTTTSQPVPKRIDALLEPILKEHHLPGMSAAVVRGGKLTAIGAAGVRARGHDEAVTIDDKFHLGSCTKSMTATVIARLVEAGKLKWDTTIAEGLPDLREKMDPAYRNVTITQLLGHRAGVPGNPPPEVWGELMKDRSSTTKARQYVVEETLKRPPASPPGTQFEYANVGYVIAGVMAERAAGKPWETLMRELIFEPLDMRSAGFGAPGTAGQVDQPWGHVGAGEAALPIPSGPLADNPAAIGPAGTVHCSIGDWAKYVALHLAGARGEAKLLSAESFKKLHTPLEGQGQEYALGWGVVQRPWAKGIALTHSGSNTMWFCTVWIGPNADIAVLIATNQADEGARAGCDQAARVLLKDAGVLE